MKKIELFFAQNRNRAIAFILIIIFMICSLTFLGDIFTDPYTYSSTIRSLDQKKVTVLGVSAAIAGSATLLASVPDDTTTPLAEELMDLSAYLLIVVCIIVLEKSLLTVFGAISCYIFFPVACILALIYIVQKKHILFTWAIKLTAFALALLIIVPTAMKVSDYIYEVNQVKIEQKVEESSKPTEPETNTEAEEKNKPWWQKVWDSVTDAVTDVANAITGAVEKALDKGKEALSNFTDAVAIFVIAYCAMPILVVVLFIWLLKYLFNIKMNISLEKLNIRKLRGKSVQTESNLIANK